ncbi:MAG: HEAT repeat domain-containing protein, partial [Sediminibacterium sp.]
KKGILNPMHVVRWAVAACIILLAGLGVFILTQNGPVKETNATAKTIQPAPAVIASPQTNLPEPTTAAILPDEKKHNEINIAEEQLTTQRHTLFAKLSDMGSPSQRMNAAAQAYQMKNADKEIVDALVKTMNTDPNTNVRLAALEALSRFHRESYVKKQLITSMQKQKDPMVQIELIDLLTKMKETTILKELDKMVKDGSTMEAVKDHAYSSIFTLRS